MRLFEVQIRKYKIIKLQEFGKKCQSFQESSQNYGRNFRTISSMSGVAEVSALPYFIGQEYSRGFTAPLGSDLENRLGRGTGETVIDHKYRLSTSTFC